MSERKSGEKRADVTALDQPIERVVRRRGPENTIYVRSAQSSVRMRISGASTWATRISYRVSAGLNEILNITVTKRVARIRARTHADITLYVCISTRMYIQVYM